MKMGKDYKVTNNLDDQEKLNHFLDQLAKVIVEISTFSLQDTANLSEDIKLDRASQNTKPCLSFVDLQRGHRESV